MNHWMCNDKSLVLSLCDLHQKCDGRPHKPKSDHSLVSQKGSNYFLRIDPNRKSHPCMFNIYIFLCCFLRGFVCTQSYQKHNFETELLNQKIRP